jgi:drug/metabolite transporter (DMT)-like permease
VPAFFAKPHPSTWSMRSIGAIVYLVLFGSIVGYSAYIFVLDRLPISVVSLYNYINPIIAVFLGWIFFREHFGVQEVIAMLIIFAGVALVKRYSRPPAPKPAQVSAAS